MDKKLRVTLNVRIQHPGSGMPAAGILRPVAYGRSDNDA